MAGEPRPDVARFEPVRVTDADAPGAFVIVCEHASNFLPAEYGTLGLGQDQLTRHIAWDPGALGVARRLAKLLKSPLVESCVSRLVIDCNRPLDAPDLVPSFSETTEIPGNRGLDDSARAGRVAASHAPFHDALDGLIQKRLSAGRTCRLVTIHSFTPVYRGVARPWEIGIIHDGDERLSRPLIAALSRRGDLTVGDNQPYAPSDRVYYTVERHGRSRGLPCVMIEIRNDEIATPEAEGRWADLLAPMLTEAAASLEAVRVAS
jgi:predicted N-formylglutamate amidohydrolase